MQDRRTIQAYINDFRRHLARFLKPQVGLSTTVHPVEEQGAILEFRLGPNIPNEDTYLGSERRISDALRQINQNAFGGNLEGFSFGGTNVILQNDRVILIKGGDAATEWNERAAADDVQRVLAGAAPKPQ